MLQLDDSACVAVAQCEGVAVFGQLICSLIGSIVSASSIRLDRLLASLVRVLTVDASAVTQLLVTETVTALVRVVAISNDLSSTVVSLSATEASSWLLACAVAQSDDASNAIALHGGVSVLVAALTLPSDTVIDSCLHVLAAVLGLCPSTAADAFACGIIPLLVNHLHSDHDLTWSAACRVIGVLSSANAEARAGLRQAGVLPMLSEVLGSPNTAPISQLEAAVVAVRGLLTGGFQDAFPAESGCFPSVVNGLSAVLRKCRYLCDLNQRLFRGT